MTSSYISGVLSVVGLLLFVLVVWAANSPLREGAPWHGITLALSFVAAIGCMVGAALLYAREAN